MFAVIKKQPRHSIKAVRIEPVAYNDIKYYNVYVKNPKRINWDKLAIKLGDLKSRALMSSDIRPPPSAIIRQPSCERYAHKLTMNALDGILAANSAFLSDKQATLIDIHCKYQGYADILTKYFNRLKIITNKLDFYNNYSDAKLYECGAAITITKDFSRSSPDESALFVSPSGIIFPSMENSRPPIITAHPIEYDIKALVYHSFFELPPSLLQELMDDADIDDCVLCHKLLGALYEFCGIRSLGIHVSGGYKNDIQHTLDDIKVNIFNLDKKL